MLFFDPSFYWFDKQLLRKLHELFEPINDFLKSIFHGFRNFKLTEVQDGQQSIKQLFFYEIRFFKCESRDKEMRWAERAVLQGKCLVSLVRKQYEETEEQSSSICSRYTVVTIKMDTITPAFNRPVWRRSTSSSGRRNPLGLLFFHKIHHGKKSSHHWVVCHLLLRSTLRVYVQEWLLRRWRSW